MLNDIKKDTQARMAKSVDALRHSLSIASWTRSSACAAGTPWPIR